MAGSNVEAVHSSYEAFNRGDLAAALFRQFTDTKGRVDAPPGG